MPRLWTFFGQPQTLRSSPPMPPHQVYHPSTCGLRARRKCPQNHTYAFPNNMPLHCSVHWRRMQSLLHSDPCLNLQRALSLGVDILLLGGVRGCEGFVGLVQQQASLAGPLHRQRFRHEAAVHKLESVLGKSNSLLNRQQCGEVFT
eukprot:Filipodium_phascolosomae@DN2752_c1_g3_i25.p1